MTTLSPKSDFLKHHEESAKLLSSHREDKWLKISLTYTIAELTTQGIDGAILKLFSDTFLQLAEPVSEQAQLPVQTLTSFDTAPSEQKKSKSKPAGNK